MTGQNTQTGILLMVLTAFLFGVQDGISRHLASEYNVLMVVMIRYWFFAAFVLTVTARQAGSLRAAARTDQPGLQITHGLHSDRAGRKSGHLHSLSASCRSFERPNFG